MMLCMQSFAAGKGPPNLHGEGEREGVAPTCLALAGPGRDRRGGRPVRKALTMLVCTLAIAGPTPQVLLNMQSWRGQGAQHQRSFCQRSRQLIHHHLPALCPSAPGQPRLLLVQAAAWAPARDLGTARTWLWPDPHMQPLLPATSVAAHLWQPHQSLVPRHCCCVCMAYACANSLRVAVVASTVGSSSNHEAPCTVLLLLLLLDCCCRNGAEAAAAAAAPAVARRGGGSCPELL